MPMFSVSGTQTEDAKVIDLRDCFSRMHMFSSNTGDGGAGDGGNDGGDGADGGKGGDGGNDGKNADGSGGDGSGSDDGSSDEDDKIKDPEKKRLSDEAARHRNEKKAAEKERDEAKAALKKIEDAKKDDLKRVSDDLEEANGKLTSQGAEIINLKMELAIFKTPGLSDFKDPSAAVALMDRKVILTADGDVDDKGIKAEIKRLKDAGSLSLKSNEGEGDGSQEQRSGGANNGRKNGTEADRAKLEEKFPALRGRS